MLAVLLFILCSGYYVHAIENIVHLGSSKNEHKKESTAGI